MFLAILTHILCRGFRFFQALTGFCPLPPDNSISVLQILFCFLTKKNRAIIP